MHRLHWRKRRSSRSSHCLASRSSVRSRRWWKIWAPHLDHVWIRLIQKWLVCFWPVLSLSTFTLFVCVKDTCGVVTFTFKKCDPAHVAIVGPNDSKLWISLTLTTTLFCVSTNVFIWVYCCDVTVKYVCVCLCNLNLCTSKFLFQLWSAEWWSWTGLCATSIRA